ncbi:CHRD domain-containing protein [Aurantiacibacter spongiae]|uniref:CHRD domain-containing protein n=1 Tax=Aurantiacibacter spongiae TaxID=2488860 RepID=A0A3N5CY77_9SPHN|nr:CHRD domain-containing protein [Aurantiacibacter spongiae]RPF71609.1 CHRD domain-containing protein [Aurantiacibacter spongiae]
MRNLSYAMIAIGALGLSACATLEEGAVETTSDTYNANLTGSAEVGGGAPQGMGRAEISLSDELGQICYELKDVTGIGPITAAHIHRGAAGTNGDVVFPLNRSNQGEYQGCSDASQSLQDGIAANPSMYYVNVHTSQYPDGAIRGQLMR